MLRINNIIYENINKNLLYYTVCLCNSIHTCEVNTKISFFLCGHYSSLLQYCSSLPYESDRTTREEVAQPFSSPFLCKPASTLPWVLTLLLYRPGPPQITLNNSFLYGTIRTCIYALINIVFSRICAARVTCSGQRLCQMSVSSPSSVNFRYLSI